MDNLSQQEKDEMRNFKIAELERVEKRKLIKPGMVVENARGHRGYVLTNLGLGGVKSFGDGNVYKVFWIGTTYIKSTYIDDFWPLRNESGEIKKLNCSDLDPIVQTMEDYEVPSRESKEEPIFYSKESKERYEEEKYTGK